VRTLSSTLVLFSLVFLFWEGEAWAHVDGKTMKAKVYRVAFSTSPQCTNPVTVYRKENPDYTDFLLNPVFGQSAVPDGVYACVIIEISNLIKVTPVKNSAVCLANQEIEQNICRNNKPPLVVKMIDGQPSQCGDAEAPLAVYLSTASVKTDPLSPDANPFLPPTKDSDWDHGLKLPHPVVVKGRAEGTLIVSAEGRVNDDEKVCRIETPAIRFQ
jgi:hypothetical protein